MRIWVAKDGQSSWSAEYDSHNEWYSDEQLVDLFLEVTKNWYEDRTNLLFGWRDRIRAELLRCLAEGDEPGNDHQLIYAEMKFSKEWVGPEGMFEVLDEGPLCPR